MSQHFAPFLDRQRRPAVGLVQRRPMMIFDSALTSHWPAPAAQWTYGRTLLR
jgi:hypothetical protein